MKKKFFLLVEKIIKKVLSLNQQQKILFFFFFFLVFFGIISSGLKYYYRYSKIVPKEGGVLKIGLIGEPQYVNPVLTRANDTDRFLIEVLYNGLFKIDGQGNLINDLASKIEISPDHKSYLVFLKENVFWHDGVPLTADDVVFTIETIQNKEYKSPLRDVWEGVVVEKISSSAVKFTLNQPYQPFLQNLTLKIIPKHIWENISAKSFPLTDYNIKPIGTGPFLFENLEKNKKGNIISYTLIRNENYFESRPYLSKIQFFFYNDYTGLKEGLLKGEVNMIAPVYPEDKEFFEKNNNFQLNRLSLYRYFAVFLNLDKEIFKNKNLREALELAIDKKVLKEEILKGEAILVKNPFSLLNQEEEINISNEYNPEKAKELIEGKEIEFTLSLPEDYQLIRVAQFLKKEWEKIGINVDLQILPIQELEREVILTKNYEALLFGEIVNQSLDLFTFWHSTQVGSYKLNLSNFRNKELDKLIEENWNKEEEKEQEIFQKGKEIFRTEKPAIFLYNPYYLYVTPKNLKGNNISLANLPFELFSDVFLWHLKTERVLKIK
ncbi:MAG: ABC transporter substrate-binding protein [Minisyncoccia bacterium]